MLVETKVSAIRAICTDDPPASHLSDIVAQLLGHPHIRHTFFVCSSLRLAPKLGAISFSSAYVAPACHIIARRSGDHKTDTRPRSSHYLPALSVEGTGSRQPCSYVARALRLREDRHVIQKNVCGEFVLSQSNRKDGRHPATFAAIFVFMAACGGGDYGTVPAQVQTSPPLPLPPPPAQTQYVGVTTASGIDYTNGFVDVLDPSALTTIATAGAASGDYDNDGDIDLFIVRGDFGPNLLYRNTGNLIFEDVADMAGIAYTKSVTENYRHSGPMFADIAEVQPEFKYSAPKGLADP